MMRFLRGGEIVVRLTGWLASVAVVLTMVAAAPAVAQLVTTRTLCGPTLPRVLSSPTPAVAAFFGQRSQLAGDGAVRFEGSGGLKGIGLYRLLESEQVMNQYPIQFGVVLDGKGSVVVREHEKIDKKVGDYADGDVLEVAIVESVVHYKKNGETLYVSPQSPRFPFDLTLCGEVGFSLSNEWPNVPYNLSPVPVARATRRRVVGKPIRFDASRSTDDDGRIKTYQWDFGDDKKAQGVTVDHIYVAAGRYIVTLRVRDDRLQPAEATLVMNVEVEPVPPAAK
jgi:hypothetical protein